MKSKSKYYDYKYKSGLKGILGYSGTLIPSKTFSTTYDGYLLLFTTKGTCFQSV